MVGIILKVTKSSFQKSMTFCRSIYVKKVVKLLAFIFEQPSYDQWLLLHLSYRFIGWQVTSVIYNYFRYRAKQ